MQQALTGGRSNIHSCEGKPTTGDFAHADDDLPRFKQAQQHLAQQTHALLAWLRHTDPNSKLRFRRENCKSQRGGNLHPSSTLALCPP